eukprot:TRINITY_DN1032_c0_g1_i1.p1 TRINITY_DN1032_c0_g1~~TRINITY_DN1032_c0_g1_i1.p1  ORF type:complete len:228 (+),score=98.01 TRINITY_DN1032_c0_g1_i1:70-684(+)
MVGADENELEKKVIHHKIISDPHLPSDQEEQPLIEVYPEIKPEERRPSNEVPPLMAARIVMLLGIAIMISGAIYAFSSSMTPWHLHRITGQPSAPEGVVSSIISEGEAAIFFSLYRVVGYTNIAVGLSVFFLGRMQLKDSGSRLAPEVLWSLLPLLTLPSGSALVEAFKVGLSVTPWYAPAAGLFLGLLAWRSLFLFSPKTRSP